MSLNQIKVELCSSWGSDRNAAEAAWASSMEKAKLAAKTDADIARVVTGLVHLHHDTPKERLWMEFFITCPIFVERQFDKYRMTVQYQDIQVEFLQAPFGRDGITQNELSGRYRTIPDRPYGLPKDVDLIVKKAEDEIYSFEYSDILDKQHRWYQDRLFSLKEAEKSGKITNAEYKRAREVLRGCLGTAYLTDMRIVMNMNAFEHIVNQRLAKDAQMESRVVAYGMVKQAIKSGQFSTMLTEMIKANNWESLMDEVESALKNDSL